VISRLKYEPRYVIQPIVDLRLQSNARYGELLLREKMPRTQMGWRRWYDYITRHLPAALAAAPLDRISVNLDTRHLIDPFIIRYLRRLEGLPVALEWTERHDKYLTDAHIRHAVGILETLRSDYGWHVVLDDMGAGHDGLRRLAAVEPDWVKIDGPLFRRALQSERVFDLIAGQVALYQDMGFEVTIEWIETLDDMRAACRMRADYGQGFFWKTHPEKATCGKLCLACHLMDSLEVIEDHEGTP